MSHHYLPLVCFSSERPFGPPILRVLPPKKFSHDGARSVRGVGAVTDTQSADQRSMTPSINITHTTSSRTRHARSAVCSASAQRHTHRTHVMNDGAAQWTFLSHYHPECAKAHPKTFQVQYTSRQWFRRTSTVAADAQRVSTGFVANMTAWMKTASCEHRLG